MTSTNSQQHSNYHTIIIGLGAMGSAAAYHLAKRGVSVLGLDHASPPHQLGSSGGHSRMIRLAYFEHPDYVPLLKRAYELWRDLESESQSTLLHQTGGLFMGLPSCPLVANSISAAKLHDLPHEILDHKQIADRFPQFNIPDDYIGFHEPRGGLVLTEKTILAQTQLAQELGATLHYNQPALDWSADANSVTVRTEHNTYRAKHLIIAAGPWANHIITDLGVPLTITRQPMAWFAPPTGSPIDPFALGSLPCWAIENHDPAIPGLHYGMPILPDTPDFPGIKIAHHAPGPIANPDTLDRTPTPQDSDELSHFVKRYLPQAAGPPTAAHVCMYTNTPDGHFILDQHPRHKNVTLAAGFSGHGFKFTPVIGQALADLAADHQTHLPIDFLSLKRFA